jgi:hypothetical protein
MRPHLVFWLEPGVPRRPVRLCLRATGNHAAAEPHFQPNPRRVLAQHHGGVLIADKDEQRHPAKRDGGEESGGKMQRFMSTPVSSNRRPPVPNLSDVFGGRVGGHSMQVNYAQIEQMRLQFRGGLSGGLRRVETRIAGSEHR